MALFSIGGILILLNIITSYRGFKDEIFFDKYSFQIDAVSLYKDYKRLITSGFLHVNWTHLLFNMFSLYIFSSSLESFIGPVNYLIIYTAGLIGGNVLSLFIHRYHSDYSSVGASGAIFAIMFSAIAIFPGMHIGLFFLPSIPGWLFGLVYVLFSIYGIRSRTSNIGHDAHLGGGLAGMIVAVFLYPQIVVENSFTLLVVAVPAIAFILFILYKPHALLIDNHFFKAHHYLTLEDKYNVSKRNRQLDLDRLLEKIHQKGMNSLSKKEKELLKEYSK
ncbi:MAG: rhomboid family intramembrane serine protease [Bacteroidota bacterium]|nr:rhomboid family intramembrane serine protease [Bacteroidota bacterium]